MIKQTNKYINVWGNRVFTEGEEDANVEWKKEKLYFD